MVCDENLGTLGISDFFYAIPCNGDVTPWDLISTNLSYRSQVDNYQIPGLIRNFIISSQNNNEQRNLHIAIPLTSGVDLV
jgi:hypothetical protein